MMDGTAVSKSAAIERPNQFNNNEIFETKTTTVTLTRTGALLRRTKNTPARSNLNPILSANQTITKRTSLTASPETIHQVTTSAIKSDIFVDKMSDQQIFNREYRTPTSASNINNNNNNRSSALSIYNNQSANTKSAGVESSVVNRLKQQICSQYTNKIGGSQQQQIVAAASSSTTTPNLRASQNRKSNLSSLTKSSAVNLNEETTTNNNNKKTVLKPTSILKTTHVRKSLDSDHELSIDERREREMISPIDRPTSNTKKEK